MTGKGGRQDDDQSLVGRVLDGDRRAFGDLVSRYAMAVHGLCTGLVGLESAEEVAHDAFVEAWLNLSSLRDATRFAPWLRTVTLNLCRQWHRQRQRSLTLAADVDPDELGRDGWGAEIADDVALDSLCRGLTQLSSAHRLTLALHYDLGLKYDEIAAFLDVPAGTVMSRLHRARNNLRDWMEEMPERVDEGGEAGGDSFREAVEAEIEVLLQLWDEESPDLRGRYFSEAGKRLSVLVEGSSAAMREVLAVMGEALTDHAGLLLRRAGGEAVAVAAACAFAGDPVLRANARRVLVRVLQTDADQPLNDPYFTLPLRMTATWILDAVIRSSESDEDKAVLLVELLPGCEDDATHIMVTHALRAYGEWGLPLLMAAWRSAGEAATAHLHAAALGRFGTAAYVALCAELSNPDTTILRRALEALRTAASQVGGFCLSRGGPSPDRSLEWRVSARLSHEELDADAVAELCQRLGELAGHEEASVRNLAIAILGELGGDAHMEAVRDCMQSTEASTRHAAIVAVRAMEDGGSVSELMRLAREDDLPVRRVALQALGHLGAGTARDLLIELLDDDAVRADAVSALGELGDDEAKAVLQGLTKSPDKKIARVAASALYGGKRSGRAPSDLRRERLARVRGAEAQPLTHISLVAAIRHLPEARPYAEKELTRLIGEVCGDYSTTRRELVMGKPGQMTRENGVYELSEMGLAVWRVERFLKERSGLP